jgi:hypothetical protein
LGYYQNYKEAYISEVAENLELVIKITNELEKEERLE